MPTPPRIMQRNDDMSISTILHQPKSCRSKQYPFETGGGAFNRIRFDDGDGNEISLFLYGEHTAKGMAIEDIFNGNVEGLAERIEDAMDQVNDMDVQFSDFALAIACDLTGADLNEAYAARKAAKVAAE